MNIKNMNSGKVHAERRRFIKLNKPAREVYAKKQRYKNAENYLKALDKVLGKGVTTKVAIPKKAPKKKGLKTTIQNTK